MSVKSFRWTQLHSNFHGVRRLPQAEGGLGLNDSVLPWAFKITKMIREARRTAIEGN